jgi:nucleoside-diphosphate-sugar epimerase
MKLLVLGGTHHVGRAVVADAVARGWDVTALNRGRTGVLPDGATRLVADRTHAEQLRAAVQDRTWDLIVDTWAKDPWVVRDAATLLAPRSGRYGYVSSRSVYAWPPAPGGDESRPVVSGDPDADSTDYACDKRGAELAAIAAYGEDRVLLARPGLVLGPWEDVGRLPWWLARIARGGRVVAPGDPLRPLQYVDARDLARWLLGALETGVAGPVDVVSRPGHTTTGELLGSCRDATGSDAELVWVPEQVLEDEGVEPWTQLPCWVPSTGELAGLMAGDTSLAAHTGLVCRPVAETVRDTWQWIQDEGMPAQRPDRPRNGLPPDLEARVLKRAEESPRG